MRPFSLIHFYFTAVLASTGILLPLAPVPGAADEGQASIARGGRLYDNWYQETRARPPETSHPAYPTGRAFARDPKTNWRCKECHGWDYRGRDGLYATGPHATGIKGIRGMAGADPGRIVAVLKDRNHGYGGLMRDGDLRDLANFVSRGQVEMDRYIDRASKAVRGHPSRRQDYYKSICVGCHGGDGHKLKSIPPLGDVARDSPWEAFHKILNGHPGEKMPALRVVDRQVLVDILAYVQTLPDGELVSSAVRGGRLYDNWRKEIGGSRVDDPRPDYPANNRHPAYPLDRAFATDPRTNWRCKECHGWDYRGRDGAYGAGRHFTGIKGIRAMAGADPAAIVAILKDRNHRYDKVLSFRDLRDLSRFVSTGQVDMDKLIDRASARSKGDRTKHAAHYTTICAVCHGGDGTMIVTTLPLGRIARRDPWRVLHTMINGHPDEAMPALRVLGLATLADVLAYVQSLPEER